MALETKLVRYTVNNGNMIIPDTGSTTATILPATVTGDMLHPTVDMFMADYHNAVQYVFTCGFTTCSHWKNISEQKYATSIMITR